MAGMGGEASDCVEPGYSLLVAGLCPLVNETGVSGWRALGASGLVHTGM